MYSPIETRPYVKPTEQVMMLIGPSSCWHFDAWLYETEDGAMFVLIETRAGGRDVRSVANYRIMGGGLHRVASIPVGARAVTLQDKALWPRFDELNAIHWQWVHPMALRVPAGFRSRSVAIHYVRAPSIEPIDGDVVNMSHYAENAI